MSTPLPVLPNVFYCYVWMSYLGNKCGSTFTFHDPGPVLDAPNGAINAQIIADALPTAWNSNMISRYPTGVTGTDSRVYDLAHPTNPAVFGHATASGSGGTDVAPVSAAAIIRHSVFRRGRGSQGHTAISPLNRIEVTADGSQVTSAFITNVTSDFENFIAAVQAAYTTATDGGSIDYVQLSRKGSGAIYRIVSSSVEALLGTERSRTSRP
jgi:hypothetical protein